MKDSRQIWFRNVFAGMFFFLLAVPALLKSAHSHHHHQAEENLCKVSAVCTICEAEYMTTALPVPPAEPFIPHFFELSVRVPYTASAPQLAFISYDPGRGPPHTV